jgi:hypothetical protein
MAVRTAAAAESDTTNMAKPARAGVQKTSGRSTTSRGVPRWHCGRDMILWRFESGFLDQPPEAAVPGPPLQLTTSRMLSLQSVSARG